MGRNPKYFIGGDNGCTGSWCVLDSDGNILLLEKTPVKKTDKGKRVNCQKLVEMLSPYSKNAVAVLERPMIYPHRFRSSISAAKSHEACCIALEMCSIHYDVIDSRRWQNVLFSDKRYKKLSTKQASRTLGEELYPEVKDSKLKDFDALLMAYWLKNYGKK